MPSSNFLSYWVGNSGAVDWVGGGPTFWPGPIFRTGNIGYHSRERPDLAGRQQKEAQDAPLRQEFGSAFGLERVALLKTALRQLDRSTVPSKSRTLHPR